MTAINKSLPHSGCWDHVVIAFFLEVKITIFFLEIFILREVLQFSPFLS
jgi:hypothetical protein